MVVNLVPFSSACQLLSLLFCGFNVCTEQRRDVHAEEKKLKLLHTLALMIQTNAHSLMCMSSLYILNIIQKNIESFSLASTLKSLKYKTVTMQWSRRLRTIRTKGIQFATTALMFVDGTQRKKERFLQTWNTNWYWWW